MATFDQLSAEQRAIIELVLQRGRSYEALADVLQIETSRVRELAREALSELSPVTVDRVDSQWRGQVADYLLGQQSGPEATATRGHLKRSEPARTWALSLLDSLDTLYPAGAHPEVPAGEEQAPAAGGPRRLRGGGDGATKERKPLREPKEERKPRPEPEAERKPLREEARPRRTLSEEARRALLRRRLLGGIVGALISAGVIIGILALAGVFGSSGGSGKTKTGSTTTAANAQPRVLGQIPLKPVNGAKATGNAFILQRAGQRILVVQAKLPALPKPAGNQKPTAAYEVWLYNSRTDAASIGAQFTDAQGNYQGAGPLPANFGRYRFVDISREPFNTDTGHSGDSLLRGAFTDLKPVQQPAQGATATPTTPGGTGAAPGGTGAAPGGTSTTP